MMDKSKLRLSLSKIFLSHGIDDLRLEIDITTAIIDHLTEQGVIQPENKAKGTMAALEAHEQRRHQHGVDVSHFPEDVATVITNVCERWFLTPPRKKSSEYGRWIECARDIVDACGEFEAKMVLHFVYIDYDKRRIENDGTPPFIVSGPCALVKVCRAKAGQLRAKGANNDNDNTDKKPVQSSFSF